MKVNVWQVGYTTERDYVLRENAQCCNMGYVEVPETEDWEEKVWNLLNWSCWTSDKPENVHSPLDHCNSDVILQSEGSTRYMCAKSIGWEIHLSLDSAVYSLQHDNRHHLWPFEDVPFRSGYTMVRDGKAYWQSIEDGKADRENWIEITW
jgi:hypothetical protein